jgi:hypothetical protein
LSIAFISIAILVCGLGNTDGEDWHGSLITHSTTDYFCGSSCSWLGADDVAGGTQWSNGHLSLCLSIAPAPTSVAWSKDVIASVMAFMDLPLRLGLGMITFSSNLTLGCRIVRSNGFGSAWLLAVIQTKHPDACDSGWMLAAGKGKRSN